MMSKYCELKLVNVLANKKKPTKREKANEDCVVSEQNFGGEKRLTRSTRHILNVFNSQTFLVQKSEKTINKACKLNKTFETSAAKRNPKKLHNSKLTKKCKIKRSNETEEISCSWKRYENCESSPFVSDLFNKVFTLKETKCLESKMKRKRNNLCKPLWENKLTGARRVSKRLSNLKTRNKTIKNLNMIDNTENKSLKTTCKKTTKNKKLIPINGSDQKSHVSFQVAKLSALKPIQHGKPSKFRTSCDKELVIYEKVNSLRKAPTKSTKKKSLVKKLHQSVKEETSKKFSNPIEVDESTVSTEQVDETVSKSITSENKSSNVSSTTDEEIQQQLTSAVVLVSFDNKGTDSGDQFESTEPINPLPTKEIQDAAVMIFDHIQEMVDDESDIMVVGLEPVTVILDDLLQERSEDVTSNKTSEEKMLNLKQQQPTNVENSSSIISMEKAVATETCAEQYLANKSDDHKNGDNFKNESNSTETEMQME